MENQTSMTDPVESVLNEYEGVHLDDHLVQLCTWSDVVKNDLRKTLKRDDAFVNKTLHALIEGALDRNGRYHYQSSNGEEDQLEQFSASYVRVQCLLAEWLCVYRAVKVYLDGKIERDEEPDLENFVFQTG